MQNTRFLGILQKLCFPQLHAKNQRKTGEPILRKTLNQLMDDQTDGEEGQIKKGKNVRTNDQTKQHTISQVKIYYLFAETGRPKNEKNETNKKYQK